MRVSLITCILLPLAWAEPRDPPPQVARLIMKELELFSNYTDYDGPTGAASVALAKATALSTPTAAVAVNAAGALPKPSPPLPTVSSAKFAAAVAARAANAEVALIEKRQAPAYWYEAIAKNGKAAFNSDTTYQVFRNVKSFGAKGDGVTDDTAAIQKAMSAGNRCAPGSCASSTNKVAVVYFPAGTYVISSSIVMYYQTIMLGNPNSLPTLRATPAFSGFGLIDGDQYQSTGKLGFGSTNVFWRQIRNFRIDMTRIPASSESTGIHWPTAQATSLQNIVFQMSMATGNKHQGVFVEEGSGGFMTDLTFNGGLKGMVIGNQQFTFRNLTFNNCVTAIYTNWDWSFTFSGITVNNCHAGVDMTNGGASAQTVGSVTVFDSSFKNTQVAFNISHSATSSPKGGGQLVIENVAISNVAVAVRFGDTGATYLPGTAGSTTIKAWGAGQQYSPTGPVRVQGPFTPQTRPASLLSGGKYYTRSKPQYNTLSTASFVTVRSAGAKGDGVADDTTAFQNAINSARAAGKVLYVDAGTYRVTRTLLVPAGSRIVGEAYPVILSSGAFFANVNAPQPVVRVGNPGNTGVVEWSDMIVSTQGSQPGAVLVQWNLASSTAAPSGMWDVHARVGGFAGSKLQKADCPTSQSYTNTKCWAAATLMHITKSAAGLYLENNWLWTADHDVEDPALTQISVYVARGLLIESTVGGIWCWGTGSEHNQRYQFNLFNTKNIFMGLIQSETAYYQPQPTANLPYPKNLTQGDPDFGYYCPSGAPASCSMAFGLLVQKSTGVAVYGAGHYSFFNNYGLACSAFGAATKCQPRIVQYDSAATRNLGIYGLSTVGSQSMVNRDLTSLTDWSDNAGAYQSTLFYFQSG